MHLITNKTKTWVSVFSVLCLIFIASYCSGNPKDANTVYAESATSAATEISKDTISLLETFQNANRQISAVVLPTVVTLDVVETKKIKDPFGGMIPRFFFGQPDDDEKSPRGNEREYKAEGLGSGVIIRKAGSTYYILTNYHVVGTANEILVKLHDGRDFPGKLIGGDERKDIALVSFDSKDSNIKIAKIGDSDTVQVGDITFAIGSPLGYVSTVTTGIVSAVNRSGGPSNNINDFIQTDAAINQGNSGGPLINIYGEVIGINSWIASSSGGSQGLGFSIPINNVKNTIDALIKVGKVEYGWIGVQLIGIDKAMRDDLGIKQKNGALAGGVFLSSPADSAGLLPGDFVIKIDGKAVKSVDHLVRDVGDMPAGAKTSFTVIRNGKEVTLSLKVAKRDEKSIAEAAKIWPGFVPFPVTDEILKKLDIEQKLKGVVATNIQTKSPAAIMGLRSGDIIVSVNDVKISSSREFYKALAENKKEVWFDVIREGQKLSTLRYKR